MFPGINPKKMQAMMKQMGMAQEEIDAEQVIIKTSDKNIIIDNPSVVKINMQGQENFQISGDVSEQEATQESEKPEEDKTSEDIQTIIEKTNCSEEEAKKALEDAEGDLTDALLALS
ncbi:nascent polypeptide-associated complex protein [archaeon]|jgi:nascent polypeptide-associated complex subunit alpha|nr:nascent polypeptide-associated complex protein [archaeon]MBT4241875.1 nascent polypeptide-associated complex protein [archaeon]MBT4418422.1 nascent polypeptide-associated complex protein [archaeon]